MAASRRMTEARWQALVREQEVSGKSVKEFARSRRLSVATFYWWRSELGRRGRRRGEKMRLAPVRVLGSSMSAGPIAESSFEVQLANGRRLRVPPRFDGEALRQLVSVLEGRC